MSASSSSSATSNRMLGMTSTAVTASVSRRSLSSSSSSSWTTMLRGIATTSQPRESTASTTRLVSPLMVAKNLTDATNRIATAATTTTATATTAATAANATVSTTTVPTKKAILPVEIVTHPFTKIILPYLGNVAYIAIASGFLMTDMLGLRILLIGGYSGLVAFHTLHERPLRIPLRWSAVFVLLNAAAVGSLLMDRYTAFSSDEEEALYRQHFERYLTRGQFQEWIRLSERQRIPAGTKLTKENVPCPSMYFLLQGQAYVYHNTKIEDVNDFNNVATIEQGGFVNDVAFQQSKQITTTTTTTSGSGAISSSTNNNNHNHTHMSAKDPTPTKDVTEIAGAYGTVITSADSDVLVWDIRTLKKHLSTKPTMEKSIHYCMSDHLVKSLLRQREARHAATSSHGTTNSTNSSNNNN